jgi:hypothetical protein
MGGKIPLMEALVKEGAELSVVDQVCYFKHYCSLDGDGWIDFSLPIYLSRMASPLCFSRCSMALISR